MDLRVTWYYLINTGVINFYKIWHTNLEFMSVLSNKFVPPTFCLFFSFTGMNFQGMLHHVSDVPLTKTDVDQPELVNVEVQID